MSTEVQLLQMARETFLNERAKQEQEVRLWADKISKLDESVKIDLDLPDDLTLKGLIPELYNDEPDEDIYSEQYDIACSLWERVNSYADSKNKEAKQCLLEYQALISK